MTETIEFDHPRTLQAYLGTDLRLLKETEQALGVKMTTRDAWVRIEGEKDDVEKVRQLFQQLEEARQKGLEIRKHEYRMALRNVSGTADLSVAELANTRIHCSPRRPPIVPKTAMQRRYVEAIVAHDMTFGIGPAGTGKTYLAMACAVNALKKGEVQRIILTRPAVEAGEALGFLPGDLREKIMPYLRPLYDALHDMMEPEELARSMERDIIEIAPLAYMRGRTLNRAFVILDEAQNTTAEQMFMFLTRLGADSKCVVTGDRTQIDLPANKRSGLIEALAALEGVDGISFCGFDERDVIRHELVQSIVRAYQSYRQK